MAILTYINKIPLYSTINEALAEGKERGLQGYHVHKYKGVAGYMGGYKHPVSTKTTTTYTSQQTTSPTQQITRSTPTTPPMGGGGYSSSGGGGGY